MRIEGKNNTQPVERSTGPQQAEKPRPPDKDTTEFQAVDSLRRALDAEADVREKMVQRGRELVGDPVYPPPETLRGIAKLLALGLSENQ